MPIKKKKREKHNIYPFTELTVGANVCLLFMSDERYRGISKVSVHQVLCVNCACLWWLVNSHNRSSRWLTRRTSISAQAVSVLPNWIWALALELYAQVDWLYCRRLKSYFSLNETPMSVSWSQTIWSNWLASDMVFVVSRLPRGFNMEWRLEPLC